MYKIYLSLLVASFTYAQSVNFDELLSLTLQNNKDFYNLVKSQVKVR